VNRRRDDPLIVTGRRLDDLEPVFTETFESSGFGPDYSGGGIMGGIEIPVEQESELPQLFQKSMVEARVAFVMFEIEIDDTLRQLSESGSLPRTQFSSCTRVRSAISFPALRGVQSKSRDSAITG
jgi:hypothetical protein